MNPGAEETLANDTDDDCDGLVDILRRPQFRGWWIVNKGWSVSGSASFNNDTVSFGATVNGAVDRDIDSTDYLAWDNGSLFVTVAMDNPMGETCRLDIGATDADTTSHTRAVTLNNAATDNGVTVAEFGDDTSTGLGPRPIQITELRVECDGGTFPKHLDWITLSNGDYGVTGALPPVTDARLDFETMATPFGGQGTAVVYGYDLDSQTDLPKRLILGTDNGGAAMTKEESTKDFKWDTINGGGGQLTDDADYAIWGVWADEPTNIYTVSGHHKSASGRIQGRVRKGNGNTEVWTAITAYYTSATTTHLAAYGAADPWNWHTAGASQTRADAGGSLMIRWHGDNDDLLVANHYHADLAGDEMGVFVIDSNAGTECTHGTPFVDLPDNPAFESGDTSTDGLVSALAVAQDGDDWKLYVGYKLRPENDNALWECTLPGTTSTSACSTTAQTCSEISGTGWDIRDIVVEDDVLFIADAGRRWVDSGGGVLDDEDTVEPQVFAYDIGTSTIYQLDETTNSAPDDTGMAWDEPTDTGVDYPDFDSTLTGTGNLRPPDAGELTTLVVSPEVGGEKTRYLFAFFDAGRSQEDYDTPVVWRAQVAGNGRTASSYLSTDLTCDSSTPKECKAQWVPMYDYSGAEHADNSHDDWDVNIDERTTAVRGQSTDNWHVDDQEIDYGWYPSGAADALFMHLDGEATLVVAGGVGVYYLGAEDAAGGPSTRAGTRPTRSTTSSGPTTIWTWTCCLGATRTTTRATFSRPW